jgi:uncharacterized protein YggT (Ycf19 family)
MPNPTQPLVVDESKRLSRHEDVKGAVQARVQHEVRETATGTAPQDEAQVKAVAAELRQNALSSVRETEAELSRARTAARTSQIVDYVFYLLYGVIGLEIVLELLGARQSSGFKRFLDAVTAPVLSPFKGLMPDPSLGSFQLMLSYVAALAVYGLLHFAVNGLLRLLASRKAAI